MEVFGSEQTTVPSGRIINGLVKAGLSETGSAYEIRDIHANPFA
jgi:hypothetical protein